MSKRRELAKGEREFIIRITTSQSGKGTTRVIAEEYGIPENKMSGVTLNGVEGLREGMRIARRAIVGYWNNAQRSIDFDKRRVDLEKQRRLAEKQKAATKATFGKPAAAQQTGAVPAPSQNDVERAQSILTAHLDTETLGSRDNGGISNLDIDHDHEGDGIRLK